VGDLIASRRDGEVLRLTITRPDQLNALNSQVLAELHNLVEGVQTDATVGAIVLGGEGGRAFCAGADLAEIRGLTSDEAHRFIRHGQRTMSRIETSDVPVIAAVDGWALGGGFELTLACHLVVASDRSRFGLPEAKIGCMPGFGGTQRIMAVTGKPQAFYLMLTGDPIDAERAWAAGLLSVPPIPAELLETSVSELAHKIASGSRTGVRSILEAGRRTTQAMALEHEAALAALAIASPDGHEGIASFAERRTPTFAREGS